MPAPQWLLDLVPQYGFWAGNGSNDAWQTGQELTQALQFLQPQNPNLVLPTLDANGEIIRSEENSDILLRWFSEGFEYINAFGESVPVPGLQRAMDHIYLRHDLVPAILTT